MTVSASPSPGSLRRSCNWAKCLRYSRCRPRLLSGCLSFSLFLIFRFAVPSKQTILTKWKVFSSVSIVYLLLFLQVDDLQFVLTMSVVGSNLFTHSFTRSPVRQNEFVSC